MITSSFTLTSLSLETLLLPEIQAHTTNKNNNQNERANIVYTGTIANAINSFILNFAKNHSHQLLLPKKYINQKTGESII
ncbi:MAG: hypothetical protein Q8S84_07305 [bacterium]|nr:hypothetical protein [bacterium]MDP3381259.1 hypothetical protein [bacterium]